MKKPKIYVACSDCLRNPIIDGKQDLSGCPGCNDCTKSSQDGNNGAVWTVCQDKTGTYWGDVNSGKEGANSNVKTIQKILKKGMLCKDIVDYDGNKKFDKNITSNNKQVKMAKEVYGGGPNNGDKLSPACSQPAPSFKNALI